MKMTKTIIMAGLLAVSMVGSANANSRNQNSSGQNGLSGQPRGGFQLCQAPDPSRCNTVKQDLADAWSNFNGARDSNGRRCAYWYTNVNPDQNCRRLAEEIANLTAIRDLCFPNIKWGGPTIFNYQPLPGRCGVIRIITPVF